MYLGYAEYLEKNDTYIKEMLEPNSYGNRVNRERVDCPSVREMQAL